MTWLLGLGGLLKSGLSAAFGWMRANPSLAVIIALSAALAWTWHGRSTARADLARTEAVRRADATTWATADRINHGTIDHLIDTLLDQSRMIRSWGATAQAKQDAAQAALKVANSRGERLEALASGIDLAPRGASWPACRSSEAVMAAKGEL